MEGHWVRTCQYLGALLAEPVLKAREHQSRDAGGSAMLYVKSWKDRLKRIEQLLHVSTSAGDVQDKKPVLGSGGVDERNHALTSSGDAGNNAGAGPSSA